MCFSACLFLSCSIPQEILIRVEDNKKKIIDFPLDYCILFPEPTYEQWDKDYAKFDQFLTKKILRTQIGFSSNIDSVRSWWCMPSARVHAQLDTSTVINSYQQLIGEWRSVCHRIVTFEDSVSQKDKKIHRNSKLINNYKDDDVIILISDKKFKLFEKGKANDSYKLVMARNYYLENKRYLMLYRSSIYSAAISFVGIDKDGRLIINSFYVQERIKKMKYNVYQATMTQLIFERIK